jgi:hypothetical protein
MTSNNDIERFMGHVDVTKSCWVWKGSKDKNGYGFYWSKNKVRRAHRFIYSKMIGDLVDGMVIDHLCHNPSCVNPDHLEQVTQRENTFRSTTSVAIINSSKKECMNGHTFSYSNTIIRKDGTRNCRTCINLLKKKYRRLAKQVP